MLLRKVRGLPLTSWCSEMVAHQSSWLPSLKTALPLPTLLILTKLRQPLFNRRMLRNIPGVSHPHATRGSNLFGVAAGLPKLSHPHGSPPHSNKHPTVFPLHLCNISTHPVASLYTRRDVIPSITSFSAGLLLVYLQETALLSIWKDKLTESHGRDTWVREGKCAIQS